jgi:hypothetical protein
MTTFRLIIRLSVLGQFTLILLYPRPSSLSLISLSLSLTLRPTVSRPVCLGINYPSGSYDQIFITVRQLRVCWCGTLSLTRGRVCLIYNAPGPRHRSHFRIRFPWGLVIIFYRLRFGTSVFLPSFNSQGYGGGIRPCYHRQKNLTQNAVFKSSTTLRVCGNCVFLYTLSRKCIC